MSKLVVSEAEVLVKTSDPTGRGEAALLLPATGDQSYHATILQVAKDSDPVAQVRGILALGILGAPGSDLVIADILEQNLTRLRPDGIAAALALALLPPETAAPLITRFLLRFQQSSYKRQRDGLLALLLGLQSSNPKAQERVLLQLLDDASNRDPKLKALLILTLGRIDGALSTERLHKLLETGAPEERRAALEVLMRQKTVDLSELPFLVKLQATDASPEVRAAALAWLTQARHLPALDLAAKAVKSSHAVEVEQGMRSALKLGGGSMCAALEDHILGCKQAPLQAAMLRAFDATGSQPFADACLRLAADRKKPLELRIPAALCAARNNGEHTAPVLRDLFLENADLETLTRIACCLLSIEKEPPELRRLCPVDRAEDQPLMLVRITALLAAGHPEAMHFLVEKLRAPETRAALRAGLLRAYRLAVQPRLDQTRIAQLPDVLQPLFRD